ncbi:MAG: response regulator transcription factor [Eubacteriales bacterium]|nr:response regulator transcription factor [Eubacteriales bacterium]
MIRIDYLEDDPAIAQNVKTYLEMRQMEVSLYPNITGAKQALLQERPDLLLVDRNMPDGTGDDVCRWVRRRWGNALPILYLTVRGETAEIVQGFRDGADDYVVKPFELEVLHSRILALLRRAGQTQETWLSCGNLSLDTEKMAVFREGEEVALSWPEYQIFLLLMENKGRTITRKQLLEQVWDRNGNYVNDNTLTVAMKRLREKLGNPPGLKTIRSFGYRMEEDF